MDARLVACENLRKNDSDWVNVFKHQVEDVRETYDVVLANIIDGILVRIQHDLKRCCNPGGYLVLTGILAERKEIFLEKFDFTEFEILKWVEKGEWLGLVARHKG